ncbi:hypothetical protein [Methanobrevibacter arboriphilus]|jgi:hypothetical protein|uniref:hypothetical protein n=1 Tax=Methanobrevibacter arboriphilus TaxID=39441 RepID=UPI000A48538A|nr:hypothetical protein [Methanobrevibacter arboriphilus]MCC7562784.1 hypothetical protein [Methanobrevibacter arboriphilus]
MKKFEQTPNNINNEIENVIKELTPKQSRILFNNLWENILKTVFEEQNFKKFKKLEKNFSNTLNIAHENKITLYPLDINELTYRKALEIFEDTVNMSYLLNVYPTLMRFRQNCFDLLNPEKLHKNEIKEKIEFNKAIYEEFEKTSILELYEKYIDPKDYKNIIEYPIKIYEDRIMNSNKLT